MFLARCAIAAAITMGWNAAGELVAQQPPAAGIFIQDADGGWPVPLVQLRTTHNLVWVSDNAGWVAVDAPELQGRPVWFHISSPGYEVAADGFGNRGVRLDLRPGEIHTVQVRRTAVARRVGRLTGNGLFAESQKLGHHSDWTESPVMGCDSVMMAPHRGRLFWAWGDTNVIGYPLGVFHMSSATTPLTLLQDVTPPLKPAFDYFVNGQGAVRGVAEMPGPGPTWLSGYVSLPDQQGQPHLCALYRKIENQLDTYEIGLCVWNESRQAFDQQRVLWRKEDGELEPKLLPGGHPTFSVDDSQQRWIWFGDPLPIMRCRATYETWLDPANWQPCDSPATLSDANSDRAVRLHSGSIFWSGYRKRYVAVFVELRGTSSVLGDVWYAESPEPTGPWSSAVKILSHDKYSFYNPRIHAERMAEESTQLYFEGTYTQTFSAATEPTPRYDYNQILYRIDFDHPALNALR